MRRHLLLALVAASVLAGCGPKARVVPIASAPPPAAQEPAFGGYGNLVVPARLADGGFATPNHGLSDAGAIWHLRAGLNVAALSCRGSQEAALIAGYNALLSRNRADFDRAYKTLGSEYGSAAAFDGAMTKLYNYYALPPAQAGLCAVAPGVLADAATLPASEFAAFAPAALARIDRPYTQVFAKQEAWLAGRDQPTARTVASVAAVTKPKAAPRITVDMAVLRMP